MKYNTVFIVYVGYTIVAGTQKNPLKLKFGSLVVSSDEHRHEFGLIYEWEVGYFLGVIIEKTGKSRLRLTQTRII